MNRRGFLSSILALGAAPAIVRADSLMRIVPRNTGVIVPALYRQTSTNMIEFVNGSIISSAEYNVTFDEMAKQFARMYMNTGTDLAKDKGLAGLLR